MDDFQKEYEDFIRGTENSNKRLRLIIDELDISKYMYEGMKLSDISPVYSNNRIKIYIPEKRNKSNTKLF